MRHGSLFTGIGGFDLAAQWMGWINVFQVEIDPFCQKVLAKNFPLVKRYADIRGFNARDYRGLLDIVTGVPTEVAILHDDTPDKEPDLKEKIEFIKGAFQCYVGFSSTEGLLKFLNESKFTITRKQ